MNIIPLLCLFQAFQWARAQKRTYLVTAPKILRLDAATKVVIQLFGYEQDTTFTVSLKSYPDKKQTFATESVTLTAAKSYQDEATLRLLSTDLPKDATNVYLEARGSDLTSEEKLPVSRDNGFLFIQTDKPLYTPMQSVKVRVFSLNAELKPALRPVTLTFLDPEAMVVDIVDLKDFTGILSMKNPFKIPLKPKLGVWKIKATYTEEFITTATTEFEVKEYVLPSISIIIQPEANYISSATFESFKVKVIARYIHGPPVVHAEVFLKFGYIEKSSTNILAKSLRRSMVMDRQAEFTLNVKEVFEQHDDGPRTLEELDGKTFYVTVTVQETTGGISQDAELATVKFCKSPYSLSLIATPPFIKPALPYFVRVLVRDPLGQPVSRVPVKALATITDDETRSVTQSEKEAILTQGDGTALFVYNIPPKSKLATFSLQTKDSMLPPSSQAKLTYTAEAYKSVNERYLYIDWASYHKEMQVGDYASIPVYFYHHESISLRSFSYQIISKGNVVKFMTVSRVGSGNVQHVNFRITADMVPSARLLVYYIMTGEQRAELVADSVWFSVKAKCVNDLKMNSWADRESYEPKDNLMLHVKAGQHSLVALSSTDTALYNLRSPSGDPMAVTLRHIERSDQGCGAGGGKDNADVFRLVGLTFMTNANSKATPLADETCSALLRPKRSVNIGKEIEKKVRSYREMYEKRCCRQGTLLIPVLETCGERAHRIRQQRGIRDLEKCKEAFRNCCQFYIQLQASSNTYPILARMELEIQFGFNAPRVRSFFPESWLWEVHRNTDKSGVLKIQKSLPDSLTTWEIKAVEMSSEGICVADPLRVQVTQAVSVDVPMPYSVVRGEQIELSGSVYNQLEETSEFCVTLTVPQGVCLFQATAKGGGSSRSTKCTLEKLERKSVSKVAFTLMALDVGEHKLSFSLHTSLGSEILIKTLRVVPEGIKTEIQVGGTLDPQGVYGKVKRRLEFQNSVPPNLVPRSNVHRLLTVNGEMLGAVIAILNDPKGLQQLTSLPRGSAEVEIMGIMPVYYVYHYMESTGRWNLMGADTIQNKLHLREKLKDGIISLMSFKKKTEHSYSMWTNGEGSTWLTALVVKTLGQVAKYATVDHVSLCNSIFWLQSRQNEDGSFREESNYKPSKIMGAGANVIDKAAFLTSFTIIGIKSGMEVENCQLLEFKGVLDKAVEYLFNTFERLKSMYVRAITSYALALVDQSSMPARLLYEQIQNKAIVKGNPAVIRFWEETGASPGASKPNKISAQTVETTAYVLLTTMLYGNVQYANPILNWLTQDQRYGGGFHSTQDTILTLEALSKYSELVKHAELKMEIQTSYRNKGDLKRISLSDKHPVATPIEVTRDDDVIVITGYSTGVSVAQMKTVFYSMTQSNENCYFDLKIEVHAPVSDSKEPMFMSPRIVACAKFKSPENEVYTESTHTVMEIHLPTGMQPFQEDLELMQNSVESRISHYEIQGDQVIIQLESVPSEDFLCVGFRIRMLFRTGMTSSSLFRVYEFYNPESQCFKLYYPHGERRLLRLCEGDECQCMAAECSSFKSPMDLSITADARLKAACQDHIKYAFKVKIKSFIEDGDFMSYTAQIEDVYKKDTEDVKRGTEVTFVKKATCTDVNVVQGSQYLIMGSEVMQIEMHRSFRYKYPLDSQTWIEKWPDAQECKGSPCKDFVAILEDFTFNFMLDGC